MLMENSKKTVATNLCARKNAQKHIETIYANSKRKSAKNKEKETWLLFRHALCFH